MILTMHHYPICFAQITGGTVTGDLVSFEQSTSEVFWTTLPQGFAFAMIVWILSATIGVVFRLVRQG